MQTKLEGGVIGGLVAGVIFGVMMQMMTAPTPDGSEMPMMAMVAQVVRSDSMLIGWLYHLFNSAVIGALFGWLLGGRVHGHNSGLSLGALYGIAWWVLGGLILMPIFLGMNPFAPLAMEAMRPVAVGSLIGHLVFGLVLGATYVAIIKKSGGRIQHKELRKL